jgi:hypothetical protein
MWRFAKNKYIRNYRLSEVIRLISVLGIDDKWAFRGKDGLAIELNGKPKSGNDWFDVAREHPEFFKFNQKGDSVVLLLRFLTRTGSSPDEIYPSLTVDQTQKLVDQAISLHDKEIARRQRNGFLAPIIATVVASIIASLTTICVSYFSLTANNTSLKSLDQKVDTIIKVLGEKDALHPH